MTRAIFIDPPSPAYYEDRLFDECNSVLNRDDTLAPFIRLHDDLGRKGTEVHTADLLRTQTECFGSVDYYSLGAVDNYRELCGRSDVKLRAFVIFEPPVVDPRPYYVLPELTSVFDRVYVHNIDGDGYLLDGVDRSKLRKLYWPQPYWGVLEDFWSRDGRMRRIVMINGNHKPVSRDGELYSKRIEAVIELAKENAIDLYGRGWERWWSRNSMWLPYWRHRSTLMSVYKGACQSKYEVLSRYAFALCFENMAMKGYVTEKIFDCLYAGTVPLYLGAKDIADLIPEECYIDCRKFGSWKEMWGEVRAMTEGQLNAMRNAGRTFLRSQTFRRYFDFLTVIVSDR